jgi:hypothetical protein
MGASDEALLRGVMDCIWKERNDEFRALCVRAEALPESRQRDEVLSSLEGLEAISRQRELRARMEMEELLAGE